MSRRITESDLLRCGIIDAPKRKARLPKSKPPPSRGAEDVIEIPVPPSANNLFTAAKHNPKKRVPSKDYLKWRRRANPIIRTMRAVTVYPVAVWICLMGEKNSPARDVANIEKAVTDSLVANGVIANDSLRYVVENHQIYRPDSGPKRVRVWIELLNPAAAGGG